MSYSYSTCQYRGSQNSSSQYEVAIKESQWTSKVFLDNLLISSDILGLLTVALWPLRLKIEIDEVDVI